MKIRIAVAGEGEGRETRLHARVRIHKGARGDEDEFYVHELQTFAR